MTIVLKSSKWNFIENVLHCTCISPQRLQLNAILVTSGLTLLTLTTVPRIATNLPRMVTKIIKESRLYLVNCVRTGHFARWRYFTTSCTLNWILQSFAFLCKLRLLSFNFTEITKFKYEKKNEKDSDHSCKMMPSCKLPIACFQSEQGTQGKSSYIIIIINGII